MRPRFQADADFNHKVVIGLRRREPSVDIWSASAGGVVGVPDLDVLRIAAGSGRVVVSHDRRTMPGHFRRFIRSGSSPGLIIVPQALDIGSAIDDLLLIWASCSSEELEGRIAFLPL